MKVTPSEPRARVEDPAAPPRPALPSANGDIDEWLGPWWRRRDELTPMFTDALTSFRPIQIRNFLRVEKALLLHR